MIRSDEGGVLTRSFWMRCMRKLIQMDQERYEVNYDLIHHCIVPRPIFLISSRSEVGDNLAPFSYVNVCSHEPPTISVAIHCKKNGEPKDTLRNIQKTGHFVLNAVNKTLLFKAIQCARTLPSNCSEFDEFDIQRVFYQQDIPHVSESPFTLYCKVFEQIQIGSEEKGSTLILAQMNQLYLKDKSMDNLKMIELIGHFGVNDFFELNNLTSMKVYRDE